MMPTKTLTRRNWLRTVVALSAGMGLAPFQALAQSDLQHDKYGGVVTLEGNRTGWFHVEDINGRWYFVTPEGHAFFSLGATHAVECIRLDERNLFQTRYGNSEEKLSEFFLSKFQQWGYNSSGYGPLPSMERRLPYVATIWTEGPRSLSAGARSHNTDIFDPVVQQRLRGKVRRSAARHIENPFCLGYVFKDLPIWNVVPRTGSSYVDFTRSLPPDAHGKKAYVDFLKQRYRGDIAVLNKTYGVDAGSFDALLDTNLGGLSAKRSEAIAADDELFMNRLADTYYTCVASELRAIDSHHLILGDRHMANRVVPHLCVPDSILATAAKYVDVISFQPMGTRQLLRGYIDRVLELSGKPVLLADVNTMTQRPKKGQVDTTEYERSAGEHTSNAWQSFCPRSALLMHHACLVASSPRSSIGVQSEGIPSGT